LLKTQELLVLDRYSVAVCLVFAGQSPDEVWDFDAERGDAEEDAESAPGAENAEPGGGGPYLPVYLPERGGCQTAASRYDERTTLMAVTSLASLDETQLVAQSREGDTGAFNELVRRYERKIFRLAQHITQNREDAEERAFRRPF